MGTDAWTQLNRLLDEALDLPPEDREPWLARLDPADEPLKPRLRALLGRQASVQASGFLESIPSFTESAPLFEAVVRSALRVVRFALRAVRFAQAPRVPPH